MLVYRQSFPSSLTMVMRSSPKPLRVESLVGKVVASHVGGSVLELGLSIASVTLGLLLGVFLLGCLTKRAGESAAIAGILSGLAAMLYVKFFTPIAFTWWVAIGSIVTYTVGWAASYVLIDHKQGGT